MNWVKKTAVQQVQALRNRDISALELLQEYKRHYSGLPDTLNPLGLELFERAEQQAIEADKQIESQLGGLLCGIPITIKDSQWLAGQRCANGSLLLNDFIPEETCEAVVRLENEGAVTLGKTTCPELCLSGITTSRVYGRSSNPWDVERTCGGSSGGAGVSVASGVGNLSLGGDGGGSIRIPSAFCGIVGFKPTIGAVKSAPGFKSWKSIVSYGPMTRTVDDAMLMYNALIDSDQRSFDNESQLLSQANLIVSEDMGHAPVEESIRLRFREVVEQIKQAGATVNYDNPGFGSSVGLWVVTATHDSWIHWKHVLQTPKLVSKRARDFIYYGGTFSKAMFEKVQVRRKDLANAYNAMYERAGSRIMITPAMGCEAFEHGHYFPTRIEDKDITMPDLDWAGFMYDANLVGMPACVVPMGVGDNGLPISLQITGAPGDDWLVLQTAKQIESLIGWNAEGVIGNYIQNQETDPEASINLVS